MTSPHRAGVERGTERHPLDVLEAIRRQVHDRQVLMRIHRRVAVTREVLGACGQALGCTASNQRHAVPGHVRIVGKGTVTNRRVVPAREHVQHGHEVEA